MVSYIQVNIYNIVYYTDDGFIVHTGSENDDEDNGENNDDDLNEDHDEDHDEIRNEDRGEIHDEERDEDDNANNGSYSVLKAHQKKNGSIRPPSQ